MEHRGIRLHGLEDVGNRGQHFVIHVYQRQGLFRDVYVRRRHSGHSVSLVKRLIGRQSVVAHESRVAHGPFAQVGRFPRWLGELGGSHHGLDARQGKRPAAIYGLDAGVGVGASQDLSM